MNSGNIFSKSGDNHVFVFSNASLVRQGVGAFSVDGFAEFKTTSFSKQCGAPNSSSNNPVTYAGGNSTGSYSYWNGDEYVYGTVGASALVSMLKNFESYSKTFDNEQEFGQLLDIMKSVGGCVDFGAVKCYVFDIGTHSNSRILTEKGAPIITDNPRRSTGGMYSYGYTESEHRSNNVGTYIDIQHRHIDEKHAVTAPLKIHYNESIGCFESNAPILARLITDVQAAAVDDFNISETELEAGYNDNDFYATSGDYYNSSFTTGLAVPFSVKSGNPHAFGPNLIQIDGTQQNNTDETDGEAVTESSQKKKLEAIRVVNRSDIDFKSGLLVLCTHIDGEWIIQKFLEKEELPVQATRAIGLGSWTFWMYTASSDEFFRDKESPYGRVTPAMALANIKKRWNSESGANVKFHPYVQLSSFDLAKSSWGGFGGSEGFIHRCNIEVNDTGGGSRFDDFDEFGIWWGPSFPEGYNTMTGSFNVPADIGISGDYPDPTTSWTSPLENTLAIAKACNDTGSTMSNKLLKIVESRIKKKSDLGGDAGDGGDEAEGSAFGYSFWTDSINGGAGSFIQGMQAPYESGTSSSAPPTPSASPSPTPSVSPSQTPSVSPSPTPSASPTPSVSPSQTPSASPSPTPSLSPSPTPSVSPTPSPSPSPAPTVPTVAPTTLPTVGPRPPSVTPVVGTTSGPSPAPTQATPHPPSS